jgi:hypothetical protein
MQDYEKTNLAMQTDLLSPTAPGLSKGLTELTERKSFLAMSQRDFARVAHLENQLIAMKMQSKRQKQVVERNLSQSATELCERIKELLKLWAVPGVNSVYFDEAMADIQINQRQRVSFGKGKRGIFLTSYVVALMEHALANENPHLGFVAIDSPVVTYRDPKHGSDDTEEALDVDVKDRFYAWLADREEPGQVIVLENEEPNEKLKHRLGVTEFVGLSDVKGRVGFFPGPKG